MSKPNTIKDTNKASSLAAETGETNVTKLTTSLAIPDREDDEREARELHRELCGLVRKSLRLAFELGGILESLKQEVSHGKWETYVRNHLGIEPRTASNYTRIRRAAESIDELREKLQSETVSDLGIREVLDQLAEIERESKSGATSSDTTKGKKELKSGERKRTSRPRSPLALRLADGSRVDLKRLGWIDDGLLPHEALERWMRNSEPGTADAKSKKLEARRQRAVVHIAAAINKACGRAERRAAREMVDSAFSIIRELIHEPAKLQKSLTSAQ